jgi:hypothetical protein
MASALAASAQDREAASRLLDEALAVLEAHARAGPEEYGNAQSSAATVALLLPVVEQLDPGRVSEVLWRSLALRGPRRDVEHEEVRRLATDAVTAMGVARYDRAVAAALLGPVLDRLPRLIAGGVGYFPEPLFSAAAIVDPRRAVALAGSLPADTDPDRGEWSHRRLLVAEMLALHGADRWRELARQAGFWDAEDEDLVDD